PFFQMLPFSFNKGQAIITSIPGLSSDFIYQEQYKIAPLPDGSFWIGSSFEWDYKTPAPDESFRQRAEGFLKSFLKIPFETQAQISGERPSSVDYRPFVGFHPLFPDIGILNGMGAKGFSQAPYFARQMAENLVYHKPILPDADIRRFQKILHRAFL